MINSLYPGLLMPHKGPASAPAGNGDAGISRFAKSEQQSDVERRINEIGSIWKGTTRMKKNNKGYERKAIKKLNKINRELKGLSNQVNEELYSSKREHQELVE